MPFIRVDDTRIGYEIEGDGAPVLFIHAGIADLRMWTPQIPALAPSYATVRFDMRGYGNSVPTRHPYSATDDIGRVIDALGLGSVHLVGSSLGGMRALDFTLTKPAQVRSLTLVGSRPAGYPVDPDTMDIAALADAALDRGDLDEANRIEIDMWVVGNRRSRDAVGDDVYALAYDMNRIALSYELSEKVESDPFHYPAALDLMATLDMPVSLVFGDHDRPWAESAVTEMLERVPHATSALIANAGHLPNLEHPREFNDTLLRFLAKVD